MTTTVVDRTGSLTEPWRRWFAQIRDILGLAEQFYEGDAGGSRTQWVSGTGWVPIAEYRDWRAPSSRRYVADIEVWVRASGMSATPRVRDVTSGTVVATGAAQSSTSPTLVSLPFEAEADHRYRVEVQPDTASTLVGAVAKVRVQP